MKKFLGFIAIVAMIALSSSAASAAPTCATIQGGTITDTAGNPLSVGFDQYGYNYQAHLFVGTYDSSDRSLDGTYWGSTGDYVDDGLIMKWSDAWLANRDCDLNGKLDRGSAAPYGTSQGWLTNQNEGDYDSDGDGTQDAHYTYFSKIVWVGPGGDLWGEYTIIQEVLNDPSAGFHGLQLKVGAPGFGLNDHWTTS
ncbi:MAG: hypothetical protein Q8P66_00805 [Candidatus Colwellbacteria bacterium]|nr:hypothetical protein [Candidatus Colwellbacteria bacterium]